MKNIITLLVVLSFFSATAQKIKGTIKGTVVDKHNNEPVPFANITAFKTGWKPLGTTSDFDGNYTLQPLDSGSYDIVVSYVGYQTHKISDVMVYPSKITTVNLKIYAGVQLNAVEIIAYKKPLFEKDKTTVGTTVTRQNIEKMAVRSVNDVAKTAGNGIFSRDKGKVNVRGSRRGSSVTFIDGVKIIGTSSAAKEPKVLKGESYDKLVDNAFYTAQSTPLSTFSIDVDKAAYANTRRYINDGLYPPAEIVRIEELINYFDYEYPQPTDEHPFSITTELADCPWNKERKIALIGLQGKELDFEEAPKNNLVFLIDVSGSMNSYNKLELLKKGLDLLIDQLRKEDRLAIVVYAGAAGVVLPSTKGDKKEAIKTAIDRLSAGGSTAGGAGIQLAYKVASKNFIEGGNNRVILATDGDFNVGISDKDDLIELIEQERETGIFLSVLGFGTGNIQDNKMEQLANKGNGNYNYIDNILEAKKVLVNEMSGTLYTIAKDVKVQAEFNPAQVKAYRLIGYVNRKLKDEDFNDDKKDAGELGAGHSVTVLYEIVPVNSSEKVTNIDPLKYQNLNQSNSDNIKDELLTVKFRYKNPEENKSILMTSVLKAEVKELTQVSDNLKFSAAVASFGMLLRKSKSVKKIGFDEVIEMAKQAKGEDENGYRAEFIRLAEMAQLLE